MKKLSFFHTSFFIVLTVMNCGFCPGSLEGLSACLLLQLVHLLAEPALLDGVVGNEFLSAHALDFDDVDTADHCLDLLVDRDQVEYLLICDKIHEPGSNLGLNDRHLGPAGIPRCLRDDFLGKSRLLEFESLLVNGHDDHRLLVGLYALILLRLLLLKTLAYEIERHENSDQDDQDYQ